MTNTNEETERKESQRKIALLNLGNKSLTNLAATYFIEESVKLGGKEYGEAVKSAVEDSIYDPLIDGKIAYFDHETGKEINLRKSQRIKSRKGGKRYTGNFDEYGAIEDCAQILQQALATAKVGDVLGLMQINPAGVKHSDKYMFELLQSKDEESQKFGQSVVGTYMQYLQDKTASDALKNRANQVKSGLEGILTEEGKK